MAKSRTRKKHVPIDTTSGDDSYDERFESALALIDGVFTSAMISGIAPHCLQGALSYGFMMVASTQRGVSIKVQKEWLTDPDLVWEPVLGDILDFVENFTGTYDIDEAIAEIEFLQNECKVTAMHELSEFEDRRHSKIANSLMEFSLELFSRQKVEALYVELAFLISWFKIGAVTGDCALENYAIVRYNAPFVMDSYDHSLPLVGR